jgi:hypothetical protein
MPQEPSKSPEDSGYELAICPPEESVFFSLEVVGPLQLQHATRVQTQGFVCYHRLFLPCIGIKQLLRQCTTDHCMTSNPHALQIFRVRRTLRKLMRKTFLFSDSHLAKLRLVRRVFFWNLASGRPIPKPNLSQEWLGVLPAAWEKYLQKHSH